MNYYEFPEQVEPPFTMGQMQEISQDNELWNAFLVAIARWRNKYFVYGMVCGTLLVALFQILWGKII